MVYGPSKVRKLLMGGLILVFLVAVSVLQKQLNRDREAAGLTRVAPLDNAPPVLAFTTKALGGFRGLIANALWIRASEMQEEGKYFEMVQLSDWITKLQPHMSAVWVNQAWNMSYNISVKFPDPADRWLWVQRGIELLRDEGLRYNPNEPEIYRELAWHFQHKMGHYLDDAHEYYKIQWARQMTEVLGKGEVNWDELLNPQTPEAKERVRRLREQYKMDPGVMKTVDEKYGPLEWRLPEAHAIYWAYLGLQETKDQTLKSELFVGLRRVIFQSLQLAFIRGRLIYPDAKGNEFVYGPNLEIIKQANDAYLEQAELEPNMRDNYLTGHRNFVGTAVYHLYTHNRKQAAQEWFNYMREHYPQFTRGHTNMGDYALSRITEEVEGTDVNKVKTIIMGAFETALMNYAIGEDDVAENHRIFGQRLWQRYMAEISSYEKNLQRVGLPPVGQIWEETVRGVLSPEYGLDPILRAQLTTRLNLAPDYGLEPATTNQPPAGASSAGITNAPAAAR